MLNAQTKLSICKPGSSSVLIISPYYIFYHANVQRNKIIFKIVIFFISNMNINIYSLNLTPLHYYIFIARPTVMNTVILFIVKHLHACDSITVII